MEYMVSALISKGYAAHWIQHQEELAQVAQGDIVVFPVPASTRQGKIPGGETVMSARVAAERVPENGLVMVGKTDENMELIAKNKHWRMLRPLEDPAFSAANAMPSAEGAVFAAMAHVPFTIKGSSFGIIGFGNLGQELAKTLLKLGAVVYVAARRQESRHEAQRLGCIAFPMNGLPQMASQVQCLFNTIPFQVAGESTLGALPKDALAIELASAPYGIDLELAKEMGIKTLLEPGIPGRYAPQTAGEILANYLMIKMEELGT